MAPRSWLHLIVWLFYSSVLCCDASPTPSRNNGTDYIITNINGTVEVVDPTTNSAVAQGSVSDGAGSGMNLTAILWLSMALVFGLLLMAVGVRLSRVTSGIGLGLGLALGIWASLINAVNVNGISDIATFVIVAIVFAIGFAAGFVTIDYSIGSTTLAVIGGMSLGIRIVLFRENLLVRIYSIDWLIITLIGVAGLILAVRNERAGVIAGSSAAGSFLVCLAIDLLVNKQRGMSFGLRYLFDRNSVHLLGILGAGYKPPVITTVLMAISIAAIPAFAILQHKLFPRPFWIRSRRPSSFISDVSSIYSKNWIKRFRGLKKRPSQRWGCANDDEGQKGGTEGGGDGGREGSGEEVEEEEEEEKGVQSDSRCALVGDRDRDDESATGVGDVGGGDSGGNACVLKGPLLPLDSSERLVPTEWLYDANPHKDKEANGS